MFCASCGKKLRTRFFNFFNSDATIEESPEENPQPEKGGKDKHQFDRNQLIYGIIYLITDTRTKLVYVGQTIGTLRARFQEHLRSPPNKFFREAIKYYIDQCIELPMTHEDERWSHTKNNEFTIETLHIAKSQEELDELEKKEIAERKSCVLDYFSIKDGEIIPLYGYNLQHGGKNRVLYLNSKNASDFAHIDELRLKELIKKGYFLSEIARNFEVPDLIIESKIQEFWSKSGIFSLIQAREKFGGMDIYKVRMKYIPIKNKDISFSSEALEEFINCIKKGDSTSEIKMKMNVNHQELYNILFSFGFSSFSGVRDYYGTTEIFLKRGKETLVKNVRRGVTHADFIEVDENLFIQLIKAHKPYKYIANALGIAVRSVYEKTYDLWGMSFGAAGRIFRIYPNIEEFLLKDERIKQPFLEDLIKNGLSVKEIDKEVLVRLIGLGYDKQEMEAMFGWDHFHITRWISQILKMDLFRARDEYWWKPRIIWLFKQGYSARQMRIVSKNLIGAYVTYDVLIRIWEKEQKIHGSNLFKYLKKLYVPENKN